MAMSNALRLVCLAAAVGCAAGFGTGAPGDDPNAVVCSSLFPGHERAAQTATSPFTVTFSPASFTADSTTPITVTISGTGPLSGFLLTTQYVDATQDQNYKPGTFDVTAADRQLTCQDGAVTHTSTDAKTLPFNLTWTPPSFSVGSAIRFRATLLQNFPTFWVDQQPAAELTDANPNPAGTLPGAPTTPATPAAELTDANPNPAGTLPGAPTTPATPAAELTDANPNPAGTLPGAPTTPATTGAVERDPACGTTKGCYSKCSGSSCDFVITWAAGPVPADNVRMTMSANVGGASSPYIALGLSNDGGMGDDSVTYCVKEGVYLSYNQGKSGSPQLTNAQEGLSEITMSLANGVLSCSFVRVKAANADDRRYALDKAYTLFSAMGTGSSARIGKHASTPLISSQAASLVDFTVNIGGSNVFVLVKAHGSLMMVAWIFAASIGIIVARYGKNILEDNTWLGQKVWFQIHRTCMIVALLATVAGFVIIFVEVGGYSEISGETFKKAHPVMGIIVTALTVINPTMALFRPHPGTKNRPIFNWLHWAVGITANVLATVTIFFGVELDKAGAPDYTLYVLLGFVAWMFLVQIGLEVAKCMENSNSSAKATDGNSVHPTTSEDDVNGEGRQANYEMSDINGDGGSKPPAKKAASNKNLILILHILVISGFTIALLIILNIPEDED